jgi:hypothetical protein
MQLKGRGSKATCWDSVSVAEAVSRFGWSGLNSEASRSHAAELLSKEIASLSRKPTIEKIHVVAHSHGGNVLLKSLLLCRREIDERKLGTIVFLGTPFFKYRSLNPDGAFWRTVRGITERQFAIDMAQQGRLSNGDDDYGRFVVIQSRHDEAFHLLSRAVQLRSLAFTYSRLRPRVTTGIPQPPTSLSPLTLLKLRFNRFGVTNIRADLSVGLELGGRLYIGRLGILRLLPSLAAQYVILLLILTCTPFISVTRRWAQRWGTYFGIKAIVSTALGDDLAFERVLSVNKRTDDLPATTIALDERVEEAILSSVVSGTDEMLFRIYRSLDMVPSELETLAESISTVFKSKQIVHSQYYQNGSVIEVIARAICGGLDHE